MTDEKFMKRIGKIQCQLKHIYDKDIQINVEQDIYLLINGVTVAYFDNAVNTKLRFTQLPCMFSASEILPIINVFNDKVAYLINQYDKEL